MILTQDEIKKMRNELNGDIFDPRIKPPPDREYWDVYRIVETIEHYQQILKQINRLSNEQIKLTPPTGGTGVPAY